MGRIHQQIESLQVKAKGFSYNWEESDIDIGES